MTLDAGDPNAVTSLGDLLPVELRHTVLVAGAALADEQGRAAALGALAPVLTAQEVLVVAPAARAITDPMLRAMVLTAFARVSPPLAAEALAAVLEYDGDNERLLSVLPALAERLNRPQLDDLLDYLAAADSALTRMWTIGTLAPYLDARQHQRALTAIGFPEPLELWISRLVSTPLRPSVPPHSWTVHPRR
jgi:hypothetical protein